MSNIIAADRTLTGAVYAVNKENGDDKPDGLLKPNDFIYDEDVYFSYRQSASKTSIPDGNSASLNYAESWKYEKDGFIKLATNKKISRPTEPLQLSDMTDSILSADDFEATEIKLPDSGDYGEVHRVNSQSLNGRTIRLSEEILPDIFNISGKERFTSNGGLLTSPFSYSNYQDDFLKFKKIFNALVNNDQAFYDPQTDSSSINIKKVIADKTSLHRNSAENVNELPTATLQDIDNNYVVISVGNQIAHTVGSVKDDEGIDYSSSSVTALHGAVRLDSTTGDIIYTSNGNNLTDTISLSVVDNDGATTGEQIPVSVNLAPDILIVEAISQAQVTSIVMPEFIGETSEVDLTTAGAILHAGSANWGTTITTANSVLANKGVRAEFQQQGIGNAGMWGLNESGQEHTTTSYRVIDYAIYLSNGNIHVYENGTGIYTSMAYVLSDTFSIDIKQDTGLVNYLKNGEVFYTSANIANVNAQYNFTGAPFTPGIGITALQFGTQDTLVIYENLGAKQTVAILSAEDADSESWSYALVNGEGDTDNIEMVIGGVNNNELILSANPAIAVKENYSVRVKVTDDYGNSHEEVVTFQVKINQGAKDIIVKDSLGLVNSPLIIPEIIGETSEVDLTTPGTILQTGSASWGTTITTANSVQANSGVWVEFQPQGAGNAGMWGLNKSGEVTTSPSYKIIDYAIYLYNGSLYVYENGSGKNISEGYLLTDVFSIDINKDTGVVTYLKNAAVFYTSSHLADLSAAYNFTGAPLSKGIGITGLQFGSKDALFIYENKGTNETVAILEVDDADSKAWTYSLVIGEGDSDNAAVTIGGVNNNEIILIANPLIAVKDSYSVRIKVTDEFANTYEEVITFIIKANQAPIDIIVKDSLGGLVSAITTPDIIGEIKAVDISTSGTILKTQSTSWASTITTANSVLSSKGVWVDFQQQGAGNAGMWGLNISTEATTSPSYKIIDYAIYLYNGSLRVYENGVSKYIAGSYLTSDAFSIDINKDTGVVTYLKNAVIFYTSSSIANLNAQYNFTGAPYSVGIGISSLKFGNTDSLFIYENEGTNQTVAIMGAVDVDSDAWAYSLVNGVGDSDNAAVVIGGINHNEIILTSNPVIASKENYSVRVKVTDEYGNSHQEVVLFKVKANQAPIDIVLKDTSGVLIIPIAPPEIAGEFNEVDITTLGTILQVGGANWSTTISSVNSVLASSGAWVEFQQQGSGNAGMWGLNIATEAYISPSYKVIDYAIYLHNGVLRIYENGMGVHTAGSYALSDVFSIDLNKETGAVTYLKNGNTFYTSAIAADLNGEYQFIGAPFSTGIGITGLQFGSLDPLFIYENAGANETIVILDVQDTDSASWTYSLISGEGDSDNNAVTIGGDNNNEIILTANPVVATKEHYSVRIKVTDNYANIYEEVVSFKVVINLSPKDLIVLDSLGVQVSPIIIPQIMGETNKVDISVAGTILRTGTTDWSATITSANSVPVSEGIQVAFKQQGQGNAGMWGLNKPGEATTLKSYEAIDYAIYLNNGLLYIYENGVGIATSVAYVLSDLFSIEVDKDTGVVTYLKNAAVFHTSSNIADLNSEYNFIGAPYKAGIGISALQWIIQGSLNVYENAEENAPLATLGVDDTDSSSWSYTLVAGDGDNDNASVTIGGSASNEIFFVETFDRANQTTFSVRVRVTDNHHQSYEEVIEFKVIANNAPTNIKVKDVFLGDIAEIDLSTSGSLLSIAGSQSNTLVNSKEQALASDGISVSFRAATDSVTLNNGMFGLNTGDLSVAEGVNNAYEVIDYALSLANGKVVIYENGVLIADHGAFTVSDLFTIDLDEISSTVTYMKNGVVFYTSLNSVELTDNFRFTAAPSDEGAGITNLEMSFDSLTVYQNIGTNQSIATLIADDQDSRSWHYSLVSGMGDEDNDAVKIGGINDNELIFIDNPRVSDQTRFSIRLAVIDNHGITFEKAISFSVQSNPYAVNLLLTNANGESLEESFVAPSFIREVATVDVSQPGVVVKTAAEGFNTLVETAQTILGSLGPSVEFSAFAIGDAGMWGLSLPGENAVISHHIIDYAVNLSADGTAFVYENGSSIYALGSYTASDIFAINVNGLSGKVSYSKNAVVVYSSLNNADLSADYAFVGAPYSLGEGISDLKFKQFNPLTIYENTGENNTIAHLTTDDDSSTWLYSLVSGQGDDDNNAVRIGGINNDQLILVANPNVPTQDTYSVRISMLSNDNIRYEEIVKFNVQERTLSTPLILDLDNDGVETLAQASGVMFDIDADGELDKTGWASADDGFLVLDVNGDGLINNASELFGEHTIMSNGDSARDGFNALSDYDHNLDAVINADDNIYYELKIWQDSNQDGISQAHELYSLVEKGISAIDFNPTKIIESNQGNFIGLRSYWTDDMGNSHRVDDVWLAYEKGQGAVLNLSDVMHQDDIDENLLDQFLQNQHIEDLLEFKGAEESNINEATYNQSETPAIANAVDRYFDTSLYESSIENLMDNQAIYVDT